MHQAPILMIIYCPECGERHVDHDEFGKVNALAPHKTHACHYCGFLWRPANVPTIGVKFLPDCEGPKARNDDWWKAARTIQLKKQSMSINELAKESHERAKRKGFYGSVPSVPDRLCLIHSEVSEALEAYRDAQMITTIRESDGKPEGLPSELADIIIRASDLAQHLGIDLEKEIRLKSDYNEKRAPGHGRVRL